MKSLIIALMFLTVPATNVSEPPAGSECVLTPGDTTSIEPLSTCVVSPVCSANTYDWQISPAVTIECTAYTQELDCENGETYTCSVNSCSGLSWELDDQETMVCNGPTPTWEPAEDIELSDFLGLYWEDIWHREVTFGEYIKFLQDFGLLPSPNSPQEDPENQPTPTEPEDLVETTPTEPNKCIELPGGDACPAEKANWLTEPDLKTGNRHILND